LSIKEVSERGELSTPESFVVADPIVDLAKRPGAQAVVALASVAADFDEPCPEKNAQMLRNGRAGHSKRRGDAAHRKLATAKEVENAAARGIAHGGEDVPRGGRQHSFHPEYNR
jgi:hypothetical protein